MAFRFTIPIMVTAILLTAASALWAATVQAGPAVPDASTYLLAPMGLAAVLTARRRRQRLARFRQGVGAAYYFVKRSFDITVALALLVTLSPLIFAIAIIVRMDSPGPIAFRRRVIGRDGNSFDMYKFRSMVTDAESVLERDDRLRELYSLNFKLDDDPRVTKAGRLLRQTSLDELPQLLNVLLGNMTFVGPRPIHADEVPAYGDAIEKFQSVTPGITGLWQTSGRSMTSYDSRVKLDLLYIEQRSIMMDLWIILRTVPAVILKRGAC